MPGTSPFVAEARGPDLDALCSWSPSTGRPRVHVTNSCLAREKRTNGEPHLETGSYCRSVASLIAPSASGATRTCRRENLAR